MMKCLKTNQVCSEQNKKCKECKLDDCKKAMEILEEYEKKIKDEKVKNIIKQLPLKCQNCNLYQITNVEKQKIYCPYMLGNSCVMK